MFKQKQEQFEKDFEDLDKFDTKLGLIKLTEESRERPKSQEKAMGDKMLKESKKWSNLPKHLKSESTVLSFFRLLKTSFPFPRSVHISLEVLPNPKLNFT